MRRGARRFSATRLDPSEGWGYSGSESRGDVERVAREEAARQAAEQARQEPEHPEIVDGTYTYGEHKDDSGYSYDAAAGKGSLDSEYTYKG